MKEGSGIRSARSRYRRPWSLDRLRDRCDEIGNCLLWRETVNSAGYPCASIDGKATMVRMWVYTGLMGKQLLGGRQVTARCFNKRCCSPLCLFSATRKEILKRAYVQIMADPEEARKRQQFSVTNGFAKLDQERADEIRLSDLTAKELAAMHKVSSHTIYQIRAGKSYTIPKIANSVFDFARTL